MVELLMFLGIFIFMFLVVIYIMLMFLCKHIGITLKEFWEYISITQEADSIVQYIDGNFSIKTEQMFVEFAKNYFEIYEKIPSILTCDEYETYTKILDKYNKIKTKNFQKHIDFVA